MRSGNHRSGSAELCVRDHRVELERDNEHDGMVQLGPSRSRERMLRCCELDRQRHPVEALAQSCDDFALALVRTKVESTAVARSVKRRTADCSSSDETVLRVEVTAISPRDLGSRISGVDLTVPPMRFAVLASATSSRSNRVTWG